MALNIGKEIAALKRMTVPELRRRYAEAFGETTTSRHKEFLIRRIIWRLQANEEGGLSERARQRAKELAADSDVRLTAPRAKAATAPGPRQVVEHRALARTHRLPMPGAVITRRYKGETIEVRVLPRGFEYEGEVYRTPERRGQEGHRDPLERLPLLQARTEGERPMAGGELTPPPCAARSTRARAPRRASSRSSTASTPSGRPARPTSRASGARAGPASPTATTTAATPAGTWSARR